MKIFRKKIGFIFIAVMLLISLGIFGWGCGRKHADTEAPSVAESEANLEKDKGILSIDVYKRQDPDGVKNIFTVSGVSPVH